MDLKLNAAQCMPYLFLLQQIYPVNDTVMNMLNDKLLISEPTCILFPQHVQKVKASRAVEWSIQPNKFRNDYYNYDSLPVHEL